jgi:hypothetical protein
MSVRASAPGRRLPPIPTIDGLWALIAVVLPVAGAFAARMMAIDLAYQIRAGGVMLDTRRLLDVDTFTYTVRGAAWLNQQWGAEVLLAAIHRAGGWTGVAIVRGLLLGVIVFLIYRTCRAGGAAPRTAAILTLAGWLVGIEILPAMRPQLFGFVIFALVMWAIATRATSPRRLWLVPPLVVIWANVHGSFPLAFVLLGLAWLADRRSDPQGARRLLAVAAVTVPATLVNPFGIRVWSYVADLSTHPVVSRRIAEWGPPSVHTPTGLLFFASIFGVVALTARRLRPVPWLPLLTLGLFAALGLLAIRGVVWWAMVAPVVVAWLIRDDAARQPARSRPPLHAVVVAALLLLVVATLPLARGTDPVAGGPGVLTYAPERLVAAARGAVPAGTNAFVSQLYASWTEFSAPALPVAVDARIEIFPESVWDGYYLVSAGREGWSDVLERWDVRVLILEPNQASGLLEVLPAHPEWRRIARDANGSVYLRV